MNFSDKCLPGILLSRKLIYSWHQVQRHHAAISAFPPISTISAVVKLASGHSGAVLAKMRTVLTHVPNWKGIFPQFWLTCSVPLFLYERTSLFLHFARIHFASTRFLPKGAVDRKGTDEPVVEPWKAWSTGQWKRTVASSQLCNTVVPSRQTHQPRHPEITWRDRNVDLWLIKGPGIKLADLRPDQ